MLCCFCFFYVCSCVCVVVFVLVCVFYVYVSIMFGLVCGCFITLSVVVECFMIVLLSVDALLVFYVNDVVYIVCCAFCVFVLMCLFVVGNIRIRIIVVFLICLGRVCTVFLAFGCVLYALFSMFGLRCVCFISL